MKYSNYRKMIGAFLVVILAISLVFENISALAFGFKWTNTPRNITINVDHLTTTGRSAALSAMSKWNAVRLPYYPYSSMVTYIRTTSEWHNTIAYMDLGWASDAIGFCHINHSDTVIFNFDIYLDNTNYSFCVGAAPNCYDYQTIIMHELGHSLGIKHCHECSESPDPSYQCSSSSCLTNVLNPWARDNYINRTLKGYDTASYQIIYW